MDKYKITLKGFLKCFSNFDFNKCVKPEKEVKQQSMESVQGSAAHIQKMLQKARKELSRAYKAHKYGKMSIEELFDYEWHVSELEQQLKNIEDFSKEDGTD
jgi:hypothetical protein